MRRYLPWAVSGALLLAAGLFAEVSWRGVRPSIPEIGRKDLEPTLGQGVLLGVLGGIRADAYIVDAIIGMHPHVVQPIKYVKRNGDSIPVAYSLGNAVANMRDRYKDGGLFVQLTIKMENDTPNF